MEFSPLSSFCVKKVKSDGDEVLAFEDGRSDVDSLAFALFV